MNTPQQESNQQEGGRDVEAQQDPGQAGVSVGPLVQHHGVQIQEQEQEGQQKHETVERRGQAGVHRENSLQNQEQQPDLACQIRDRFNFHGPEMSKPFGEDEQEDGQDDHESLYDDAYADGYQDGYQGGYQDGYQDGYDDGHDHYNNDSSDDYSDEY